MAQLLPSTRLVIRDEDNRSSRVKPVAVKSKALEVEDGNNSQDFNFGMNGRLTGWVVSSPNIPTDANFTVTILAEDGEQLYQLAGIAKNSVVRTDLTGVIEVMPGNTVVRINFTTALSGDTAVFDVEFDFVSDIF